MPITTAPANSVMAKSRAFTNMSPDWQLVDDLQGGTRAMRAAAQAWLPMEPKEKIEVYALRLGRSFLYNGYSETVTRLSAKPFTKPVTIKGSLPDGFEEFVLDVDGEGHDLTQFAGEAFEKAVDKGLAGILVDYPTVPSIVREGEPPTLADEKALNIMPYFVLVQADRILGFKHQRVGRKRELTELRILEESTEQDGEYGEKTVVRVRKYTRTDWTVYRIDAEGHETIEEGPTPHTFGSIPFVELNLEPTGVLEAKPPMKDLAWLNMMHWQSSSDQRWILRVARCAILFAKGFEDDELKGFVIGPTHIVKSANVDADLKHVEHRGQAIAAGQVDIDKIEARMEVLGLAPLVKTSVKRTLGGQVIDEVKSMTVMQSWVRLTELAFELAFRYAAQWRKVSLPDDFGVDIYSDFGFGDVSEVDILLQMRVAGELTRETFLAEINRRGLLSDDTDMAAEVDNLNSEEANAIAQARDVGLGGAPRSLPGTGEDDDGGEGNPASED